MQHVTSKDRESSFIRITGKISLLIVAMLAISMCFKSANGLLPSSIVLSRLSDRAGVIARFQTRFHSRHSLLSLSDATATDIDGEVATTQKEKEMKDAIAQDLNQQRMSHSDFFRNRDWQNVQEFWSNIVQNPDRLVPFIEGDNQYGVADLKSINAAGMRAEFVSKDSRYTRKNTFAFRIGYVGSKYNGYQRQNNSPGIHTVEDDIKASLGRLAYGAGRTDSQVSAVSQVICISSSPDVTAADLLTRMKLSEPVTNGRLQVYDCYRVPHKFNARSSATWRRYLYLLPLNTGQFGDDVDIDISFVNDALKLIENISLPYNGFAHGENRNQGEGLEDFCTMYRAKAYIVSTEMLENSSTGDFNANQELVSFPMTSKDRLTGLITQTESRYTPTSRAMCVELVGSRFLRKMVRILVATAARESVLPAHVRNVNILIDICDSGNRLLTAVSLPGEALCFAGVGYDQFDLAIYKLMPKKLLEQIQLENLALMKTLE
jgi:tRNA pseudouridine(38-40) synthase